MVIIENREVEERKVGGSGERSERGEEREKKRKSEGM